MAPPHCSFAILGLCLATQVGAQAQLEEYLTDLAAPRAESREAAERWLSLNLEPGSYARLVAALPEGEEARRRLASALAAEDRHVLLAASLYTSLEPEAREIGEDALTFMLLDWTPGIFDPPMARRTGPHQWEERGAERMSLDPTSGAPRDVFERFVALARGPSPLVLDPVLDMKLDPERWRPGPAELRSSQAIEGTFTSMLSSVVRRFGVSFEVHGVREGDDARGFVRLCPRGTEGGRSGGEWILEWLRITARGHDPTESASAARALAATGWPAAVRWLEHHWVDGGSSAAFEGLVLAAASGRVAPVLRSNPGVRALISRAAGPHPTRVARALGNVGGDLSHYEAGWGGRSLREKWVLLTAIELRGRVHLGEDGARIAALCDPILAATGETVLVDAAKLAALRARRWAPVDPAPLVHAPERLGFDVVREWIAIGAVPSGGFASLPAELGALWSLGAGDLNAALPHLASWSADAGLGPVALGVEDLVRRGAELSALNRMAAPESMGHEPWKRLLRLAGIADFEGATAESLTAGTNAEEWLELGALAAAPEPIGGRARQLFEGTVTLGEGEAADLKPALQLALTRLERQGNERVAEEFAGRMRRTAGRARHPIAGFLYSWGAREASSARSLEAEDRALPQ